MDNNVKSMLEKTDVAYGAWLSLPDSISTEIAAHLNFDYICVDMQHGSLDYQETVVKLQVIGLGSAVPIVRVPVNEFSIIGKVLDVGAMAIIVPMVNNAEEAQAAVSACRYPPEGSRSKGHKRPMNISGVEYFERSNQAISVIPMIETADGLNNIDDIASIDGVDAIYVGPNDLQLSLGIQPPELDSDEPAFKDAIKHIVARCKNAGVAAGIHASPELAPKWREQGFEIITVASDFGILRQGLQASLNSAKN